MAKGNGFFWGGVIPEIDIENSFATPMYSEYMKTTEIYRNFSKRF